MKETEKPRYTQEAESRYHEIAANLARIKDKVEQVISDDFHKIGQPLQILVDQAETQLAMVQERITQLKHADDASWQSDKRDLETGWEDLIRSITNLVTRLH